MRGAKQLVKFSGYPRNVSIRLLDSFFSTFTTSVVLFFLPLYLAKHFGPALTGLLLVASLGAGIFAGGYSGYVADKFGRKPVIFFAELVRFCAIAIMAWENSPWVQGPLITFLASILFNVCSGMVAPASDALIMDAVTEEMRNTLYTNLYWIRNIAYATSSLLGGLLFASHVWILFLLMVGTSLSTNILVTLIQDDFKMSGGSASLKREGSLIQTYRQVWHDRMFRIYAISGLLALSLECQLSNYIGVRLELHVSHGVRLLGLLGAENTILVVLLAGFIGFRMKAINDFKVIMLGWIMYALGVAVFSISNNPIVLFISMVGVTFGEISAFPRFGSYLVKLAPSDSRAAYSAIMNMVSQMATGIGALSISLGSILSGWQMALVFLGICGIAVSLLPVIYRNPGGHLNDKTSHRPKHEPNETDRTTVTNQGIAADHTH